PEGLGARAVAAPLAGPRGLRRRPRRVRRRRGRRPRPARHARARDDARWDPHRGTPPRRRLPCASPAATARLRRNLVIRVALVDDQKLVRAGFRMVIDSQPDLEVVIEADDGEGALASILPAARAGEVDVVLMDIRMPRLDGIAATDRITAAGPSPRVIVLTTFDLDEYVLSAIRAGASGFLLKDAPPEEMLAAI